MNWNLLPSVICLLLIQPAHAQEKLSTSIVVLRNLSEALEGEDALRDEAVFLNSDAEVLQTVEGMGFCQANSYQNKVVIDSLRDEVYVVETLADQITVLTSDGNRNRTISMPAATVLTMDEQHEFLAITGGELPDSRKTRVIELESSKNMPDLAVYGYASVRDPEGNQLWIVGNHITAISFEGVTTVSRPPPRLDPEAGAPTVYNSKPGGAVGVAFMPNEDSWARLFWIIERDHPSRKGSKNRLYAINETGRIRVLTELGDIDPVSIACHRSGVSSEVYVVDRVSGDLLEFNSDGELWKRHPLNAKLVAASPDTGLWIVNDSSIRRLDPKNMEVLNLHEFDEPAEPVGLTLRQPD